MGVTSHRTNIRPFRMKTHTCTLGFALILINGPALAQIPNAGFEDWTDFGAYEDPSGWASLNILTVTIGEVTTCERVTPGYLGGHAVRVMTADVPGFGVMPGMLLSGDPTAEVDGFPYTQRPGSLTGMWKAELGEGEAAMVGLTLSRWNAVTGEREVIGTGEMIVTGSVPNWTAFTVGVEYISEEVPDTASIAILSSMGSGVDGSSITVDALAFSTGGGTGVGEAFMGRSSIFPVPANDRLNMETHGVAIHQLELWSVDGRLMHTERPLSDRVIIEVRALAAGTYVVVARMVDATVLRSTVVKQ